MRFRAMLVTLVAGAALFAGGCAMQVDGAEGEDLDELVDVDSAPLLAGHDPSVAAGTEAEAVQRPGVAPPDEQDLDLGGVLLGCDPEPEPWQGGHQTGGGSDKDAKGHD